MKNELSTRAQPDPEAVARAAAEWVLRLPEATAADEAEFGRWLAADPRHEEVFAEMNQTSALLDQLRDPALAGRPVAAVIPMTAPVRKRSLVAWIGAGSLAAAAALAIGYITWWRPAHGPFQEVAATELGGLRRVELPDGSVVQLNTSSAIEVNYSVAERRVRLTAGEAFFTVAKNPNRPFYVEAGAVSVRAVGTAFNVRHRPEGVEVMVTEGKVKVDETGAGETTMLPGSLPAQPKPELYLVAGQRTVILKEEPVSAPAVVPVAAVVAREDMTRALAWTENRLQFSATPLAEIVGEFNRYNKTQLVIGDPTLADQRFGGAFTPTGYDSFLELLEQNFGITAERRGSEIVLRKAP